MKNDSKEKDSHASALSEAFGELLAYGLLLVLGLLGALLLKLIGFDLDLMDIDGDTFILIGIGLILLVCFIILIISRIISKLKRRKSMNCELKITFLGTCACDFSPRLKTDLADSFERDARRSSSMLMDDRFLIDCGPHTLDALRIAGKDKDAITDLFITHTHSDHYDPKSINAMAMDRDTPLRVWASDSADLSALEGVEIRRMKASTQYTVSDCFSVTGLFANHDPLASPQHLYFDKNGKKAFYGCDGAWLLNKTYYFLKDKRLDLAVLDCTTGDYEGDFRMGEHNSIPMLRVMLPSLRTFSVIDEHTEVYFSHLAPSLHAPHEETVNIAAEMGAKVAFDGLEFTL